MNSILQQKSELRKVFRQKRSALSASEVSKKSQKIAQNFIKNLLPKIYQKNPKKSFALYLQSGNEVGTGLIASHFEKEKITFSYPKISRLNAPLDFIEATPNQDFLPNDNFPKIFEPDSGRKIQPDILIIPLLAFDKKLSRLGMGGGFYDRTIHDLRKRKEVIVVAVAYDCQKFDGDLPCEKTDLKPDYIITETKIVKINV